MYFAFPRFPLFVRGLLTLPPHRHAHRFADINFLLGCGYLKAAVPTENRGVPSGWLGGRSYGYFFGLRTRPQAGNIRATRLERARYRSSPSNPTRTNKSLLPARMF